MSGRELRRFALYVYLGTLSATCLVVDCVRAEEPPVAEDSAEEVPSPEPAAQVEVKPVSRDEEIAARLQRILQATEWFTDPHVEVTEGVAFLEGETSSEERKEWAAKLASNTRDVVAVANRIGVTKSSIWDFTLAWKEIDAMRRSAIQSLPALLISLLLLIATWFAAMGFSRVARRIMARRTENPLLREVLTKAVTIPLILLGIYLALRVSGLTRLAATVLGGTGLAGLILGIAFRDIAENFLASLLISMQRPFNAGDTIVVEGRKGLVQAVTTRGTTIITPDGNHVRVPNAIIYKSVIENQTANPKQRQNFVLSVDDQDSVANAQEAILEILLGHEAVLKSPEPLVLVSKLVRPRVMLQIYYWIDVRRHSGDKVRSAIIRQTKVSLQQLATQTSEADSQPVPSHREGAKRLEQASRTRSEGGLESETKEIEEQARHSRSIEEGVDLLRGDKSAEPAKATGR